MEYFGYKKAGEDIDKAYIDWAGITKTISDEIRGTLNERQEKRTQLEKDHLDRLKKLNEFEAGVDPSLNTHLLKGAQQYRDYIMANHKQMKAGLISVDDAKIKNQNAMDGFTFYKQTLDSLGANVAALSELEGKGNEAVAQEIAQIMNFGNNTIVPDMNTGEPYLVPKNDDGSLNMDAARPLRALPNIVGQKFAFVDVESTTDKIASSAGTWKQTFASGASIEDSRQNPNYQKWIENTITSNLNNDEKLASVLMDYLGMGYSTSGEEGKIKVSFDRSTGRMKADLTDAQRKQARDAFRESIEAKIGAVRVAEKEQKPTETERAELGLVKSLDRFLSSGDKTDLDAVFSAAGVNDYQFIDDELRLNVRDKQGNLTSRTVIPINEGMSNVQLGNAIAGKIGIANYKDKTTLSSEQQSGITYDPSKLSGIISENTAAQKLGKVSARSDGELLKAFKDDGYENAPTPEGIASAARLVGLDLGIPTENIKILDDGVSLEVNGVNLGDPTLLDAATVKSKIISTISTQGGSSDDFINLTKNAINSNK